MMLKLGKLVLILGVLNFLGGCKKASTEKPKLILLNVLGKQFFDDCHIAPSSAQVLSTVVEFEDLDSFADTLDRSIPVVLYCSNYQCTASGSGAALLHRKGFSSVYVYEGGMAEWKQKGLPVEGPCTEKYLFRVVEAPVGPVTDENLPYTILTAEELHQKMLAA